MFSSRGLLDKLKANECTHASNAGSLNSKLSHKVKKTPANGTNNVNCSLVSQVRITRSMKRKDTPNPARKSELQISNEVIPLSDLPPMEAALSINKLIQIRTRIFSSLSFADLKNCRLVCREWQLPATNVLMLFEIRMLYIGKVEDATQFTIRTNYINSCKMSTDKKISLKEFTDLLDATGPNVFPCNDFEITYENDSYLHGGRDVQYFLNNHGFRIKSLCVSLEFPKRCPRKRTNAVCGCLRHLFSGYLTKLLVEQAPNLKKLFVHLWVGSSTSYENQVDCKPLVMCTSENVEALCPFNLSLRYVWLTREAANVLFDWMVRFAPMLEDVAIEKGADLYLEPVNRVYLLKEFYFHPKDRKPRSISAPEAIVNLEGKLELRHLQLEVKMDLHSPADTLHRVVNICNNLLEKSCSSLTRLEWTMNILSRVKIPKMPNVKILKFIEGSYEKCPRYLPTGTSFSSIFPKLHTIIVSEDWFYCDHPCPFMPENENAPSVKIVKMEEFPIFRPLAVFNKEYLEQCKRWFPEAKIIDVPYSWRL